MSERIRKFLAGIYPGTLLQFRMLRHYVGLPAAVFLGIFLVPVYWAVLVLQLFKP